MFWNYGTRINSDGEADQRWRPITCLVDDHGRDIDSCPNCGTALIEQDDEEEEEEDWAPEPCKGCKYYSSNYLVACAVHPYGPDDDICPDYSM
ncbi:hypothetical protein NIES4071_106800 (plasmid) [Calothrix sp. NIES-4071]|nr:hypothetical protein NIES4071_106800 [Calothrix sp. NIES-4071]BAZ65098.1 hypothetical protein NIES4105_108310 [Calothrix sp. NIES-4105]